MSTLAQSAPEHSIVFDDVSKFYGEVLGVNRVISRSRPASPASWARTAPAKPR